MNNLPNRRQTKPEERRLLRQEQPLQDKSRRSKTLLLRRNKRSCRWSCWRWSSSRNCRTLRRFRSKLTWIWRQQSSNEALLEIHLSWLEPTEVEDLVPSRVAPQITTLYLGLTTTWWKIVEQAVPTRYPASKTQPRISERLKWWLLPADSSSLLQLRIPERVRVWKQFAQQAFMPWSQSSGSSSRRTYPRKPA